MQDFMNNAKCRDKNHPDLSQTTCPTFFRFSLRCNFTLANELTVTPMEWANTDEPRPSSSITSTTTLIAMEEANDGKDYLIRALFSHLNSSGTSGNLT